MSNKPRNRAAAKEAGREKLISQTVGAPVPVAEKPQGKKENPWVAWIALVIAIVGGIPGCIGTLDYFKRSSLSVHFDERQSVACGVQTDDSRLTNKLAIVLYHITVIGGGVQPTFIRDFQIEAKIHNKWIVGSRFTPKLFTVTNVVGDVVKAVHLKATSPSVAEATMVLVGWNEKGNEIGAPLQYGQPLSFSYAALFDVDRDQFRFCDELKITTTDYQDREYKSLVKPTAFMKATYSSLFLVLDRE